MPVLFKPPWLCVCQNTNILRVCVKSIIFQLKIKKTVNFGKLKESFCRRFFLKTREVGFVYDYETIKDEETPMGLNMKDFETITVYRRNPSWTLDEKN